MKKIIFAVAIITISGIHVYKSMTNNQSVRYSDLRLENIELLIAFGDETGEQTQGATSHGCGTAVYMWSSPEDNWSPRKSEKFKTCAPGCPQEKGIPQGYITC